MGESGTERGKEGRREGGKEGGWEDTANPDSFRGEQRREREWGNAGTARALSAIVPERQRAIFSYGFSDQIHSRSRAAAAESS